MLVQFDPEDVVDRMVTHDGTSCAPPVVVVAVVVVGGGGGGVVV